MTSRELTQLLPLATAEEDRISIPFADRLTVFAYGAIGWPWLAKSLWGGPKAARWRLNERLNLPQDALPHLGSWKADTGFLHLIVDTIEEMRPRQVVEFGVGASSLVIGRALQLNGNGRLTGFDQHGDFVVQTRQWLQDHGIEADLRHAPLAYGQSDWPGPFYTLDLLPDLIDLLVIDGPPWTYHPLVRGGADKLFPRLAPGGVVLLDDGARPGERQVLKRWAKKWPDMRFQLVKSGTKGTIIGIKR